MDTGPLVAWFCVRDSHHDWAVSIFDPLPTGMVDSEAVLTEACHLVAKDGVPQASVLRLVERNDLVLVSLAGETTAFRSLIERYADTPMDFADACVTRLVELYEESTVCTTDTDPLVYRKNRSQVIPVIAPFGE